jgi:hypothetical protein
MLCPGAIVHFYLKRGMLRAMGALFILKLCRFLMIFIYAIVLFCHRIVLILTNESHQLYFFCKFILLPIASELLESKAADTVQGPFNNIRLCVLNLFPFV